MKDKTKSCDDGAADTKEEEQSTNKCMQERKEIKKIDPKWTKKFKQKRIY